LRSPSPHKRLVGTTKKECKGSDKYVVVTA
jgi:hypothetical protein